MRECLRREGASFSPFFKSSGKQSSFYSREKRERQVFFFKHRRYIIVTACCKGSFSHTECPLPVKMAITAQGWGKRKKTLYSVWKTNHYCTGLGNKGKNTIEVVYGKRPLLHRVGGKEKTILGCELFFAVGYA